MTDEISRINDLRQRVRAGEQLTKEEMAEALRLLRADRERRIGKTEKKETKSKPAPINLDDLFKD